MTEGSTCPACGKRIDAGSPEGLCPACLMEQGLNEQATTVDAASETTVDSAEAGETQVPTAPRRIGPYQLLRKLGEGGMGEVWLAEQTEPVKRQVAIKLIKAGMDSKQVLARFEAERQALAMMEHPSIARVFEAGATEQGSPYFVMEYARGVPITEHCDREQLTTDQRLDLFMQVCAGVQHAHQKGIIHRDLKPSNVLVTIQDGKAVPKIIDFGIAKATEQRLTEQTLMTGLGVLVGTPAYMSPEQADLTTEDIDTRSDVYSLGVLLYELLAGALPFEMDELRRAGFEEILRHIREVDPPRPSARLTTQGGEKTRDARRLQGDLDWIVMRALEKDRARRYGSPNEFAADIQRHLAHEPVLAGPPSATYRTRKFVRRHRLGVGFAAVLVVVLIGFAVTMTVQAGRIARQRDRADQEANVAGRVSEFMVRLFAIPDPGEARGNEVTARELLDKGAKEIESGLKEEPVIRARMMATMGNTYRNLGLLDQGQSLLEQALEIQSEHLDGNDLTIADTLVHLGGVHYERNRIRKGDKLDKARDYWTRALEIRRAVLAPNDPEVATVLTDIGWTLMWTGFEQPEGAKAKAEALAREAQQIWASRPDIADWRAAYTAGLLSWIMEEKGDMEAALAFADYSLDAFDRATEAGEYWPPLQDALYDAGFTYGIAGRIEEALELFQRSREYRELLYGPDHALVADVLAHLGALYRDAGRFTEARQVLEQALAMDMQVDVKFAYMAGLSRILWSLGDIEGAYEYRRQVMEIREANPDLARSPLLLGGRLLLADLLMRLARPIEARVHYRGAIELFTDGVPSMPAWDFDQPGPPEVEAKHELAVLVAESGEFEDAHVLFEIALINAQGCGNVARRPSLQVAIHRDWAALLRRMGRDTEASEHEALAAELAPQP